MSACDNACSVCNGRENNNNNSSAITISTDRSCTPATTINLSSINSLNSRSSTSRARTPTPVREMIQRNNQNHQNHQNCDENGFDHEEEFQLNRQVNTELEAFYHYLALYTYYDRDDTALKGFSRYYLRQAYEELDHAMKIIRYMNKRGARVKFCDIAAPQRQSWCTAKEALQSAMAMEKKETTHLIELHETARCKKDHHLEHYLITEFMGSQLDTMNELGERCTHLGLVGDGPGMYLYDRHLLKEERKRGKGGRSDEGARNSRSKSQD